MQHPNGTANFGSPARKSFHGARYLFCILALGGVAVLAITVSIILLETRFQPAVDELLGSTLSAMPSWAPISASVSVTGDVDLTEGCIVKWELYRANPWAYPTFELLAAASGCTGASCTNCMGPPAQTEAPLPVGGVIFHDGSIEAELLAAMLTVDPTYRVIPSSSLLANALQQCRAAALSHVGTIRILRLVLNALRNATPAPSFAQTALRVEAEPVDEVPQSTVFLVLPAEATADIGTFLEAFGRVPWAYVYNERTAQLERCQSGRSGSADPSSCDRIVVSELVGVLGALAHEGGVALPASRVTSGAGGARLLARHFGLPVLPPDEFRMGGILRDFMRRHPSSSNSKKRSGEKPLQLPQSVADALERVAAASQQRLERLGGPFSSFFNGEIPPHQPWKAGLTRLVDADAPMWLSSEGVSEPFDPFDCPDVPARSYPREYPVMDLLRNWPTDAADHVPPRHYLSLCRFDYVLEYDKALAYRDAEVPFIVYNVSVLDETVRKWSDPEHLVENIDRAGYRTQTEHSVNNHFMYHTGTRHPPPKDWKAPTERVKMSYAEWLSKALVDTGSDSGDAAGDGTGAAAPPRTEEGENGEHYYFRVTELKGVNDGFIARSVNILAPGDGRSTFFLKEPSSQKGIHCRFGMHGVIAEAHHDGSRNMVAMVSGKRRWLLAHPRNCVNMHVYPRNHPSARHAAVDFSRPNLEAFPRFKDMMANEVILRAGEVLYVPTDWIHFIVSLGINAQCNARSGTDESYSHWVRRCTEQATS